MSSVRVKTDRTRIKTRISLGKQAMIHAVTEQVIQDSNYYCRQDQGGLIASSLNASQPKKGLAVWDTPYAKRVFYTGTPCTDVNPNASLMWVEKARENFGDDWETIADKNFKEGMGL